MSLEFTHVPFTLICPLPHTEPAMIVSIVSSPTATFCSTFVLEGSTVEVPVPSPPVIVVMSSGQRSFTPTEVPSSQVLVVIAPPPSVTFVAEGSTVEVPVPFPPVSVTFVASSSSSSSPVTLDPTTVLAASIALLAPPMPLSTMSLDMPVVVDIIAPTTSSMSCWSTPSLAALIMASSTALPVVVTPT